MKRCSACHFTFEDHEQVCDFDGTELMPHPEPVHSFENVSVRLGSQSTLLRILTSRISLAFLMLVGVILSALVVGYFDAASQARGDTPSDAESLDVVVRPAPTVEALIHSPTQVEPPVQSSVHVASQDMLTKAQGTPTVTVSSQIARRRVTAFHARVRVRSSTTQIGKQSTAPENADLKESKVTATLKKTGSILKKTVGILKKPFGF